ncbi:MAG: TldD/PmbA family protein [Candidatus Alcyoniella australis]|nr:TldD/PmbA family protein [Candidatus Alcyoniella australis]
MDNDTDFTGLIARCIAAGAEYADLRRVDSDRQTLDVRNGAVDGISDRTDGGVGLRVLYHGAWGFAATSGLDQRSLEACADRAVAVAKASAGTVREPVRLAPVEPLRQSWTSPLLIDPAAVSLADKLELLLQATELLRGDDERIVSTTGSLRSFVDRKLFVSSEGSHIEQTIVHCGGGIGAVGRNGDVVQSRHYPQMHGGDYGCAGWEFVEQMGLVQAAPRVREELLELLEAPDCPVGPTTLIIGNSQLALQVHESCGHPAELDRVLGTEIAYAGGSFITLDKLGTLRYGSDAVTIVADATVPGGLGSFGYDDEGVPAQAVPLVERGLFVGYLSSRETAPVIGRTSGGAMRADGWNNIPLIRMTNVNLQPGDAGSLEDLIADTQSGVYVETNKSWSIDDLRLNFQFGTEYGRLIENGRLTRVVKNPVYTGITPEFWNSCDAVCSEQSWKMWGVPNCGKGQPGQVARVGHGTSPARFRNVTVGAGK